MASRSDLFESAIKAALDGATVLTGNVRASRQLRAECDRRMRLERKAWLSPDILPLSAWLQRTASEALVTGAISVVLLAPAQEAAVWQRIILESGRGGEYVSTARVAREAIEAWRLLHAYGGRFDGGAFRISDETRCFQAWAQEYAQQCFSNSWIDAARLPDQLATISDRISLGNRYVLFGFDELTPQTQSFMSALTRAGANVMVLHDAGRNFIQVPAVALPDASSELRAAATWARNRLQANPAARIGIIVPNLESVLAEVEHVMTETLQPESLLIANIAARTAFDISLGPALSGYAVAQTGLIALRLAAGQVSHSEVELFLRSPYIDGSESERSARARFDLWLRGHTGARIGLANLASALAEARSVASCPILGRALNRAAKIASDWIYPARAAVWSERAGDLLTAIGWPGETQHPLDSVEYQTISAWSQMLSEFSALDCFFDALSADAFIETISSLAGSRTFRSENVGAPVQVMGPFEAAGSSFDHLWFCGLTDAMWPSSVRLNPFLPPSLQRDLIMPHSSSARELAFARKITRRLAASTNEFILSWPKHEEDQELRASPLLAGMQLHNASEICGPAAPNWVGLQRPAQQESFQDEAAPPVEGSGVYPGGTRVFESQSRCPFMCFAQMRLGAERLDEPVDGLAPTERGKAIELVLQLVWNRLRDSFTLQNTSAGDLDKIITQSVDEAIPQIFPTMRERWTVRYAEIERQRLIALTREWLEVERGRSPFEVIAHQQPITITAGSLTVNGRIDRLDHSVQDDAVVVLDYKSGGDSYTPGQWQGARPRSPQLPLYAAAQDREVAAVAFANVRRGNCGLAGYGNRKEILGHSRDNGSRYLQGDTFEQHVERWRSVMTSLADAHVRGVAAVDPLDQNVCKHCHLTALCRVAETEAISENGDNDEH